jgi:cellobiose epimerase
MTTAAAVKHADLHAQAFAAWAERIKAELVGNILPFWPRHVLDRVHGGFIGEVGGDLTPRPEAPRGCVLNARIVWTYSAAARLIDPLWRATAEHAFDYFVKYFWDRQEGGLFWMLAPEGAPVDARKQTYAQAFGIYALAEYHRATGDARALDLAKRLYGLVETHCFDSVYGGYFEARDRAWKSLDDVRLSDKDLNAPKSMNTHLHVLEAYTNLLRVWPDAELKARHRALIRIVIDRVVDRATAHFRLFFDAQWNAIGDHVSYGHDIEGNWLLTEAAEVQGDPGLMAEVRALAVRMAAAVADQGLDGDGSLLYEADGKGRLIDAKKHWWAQAEAVIGFFNAFEISGNSRFLETSQSAWDYIEAHVVDRVHGEWRAKLSREGVPLTEAEDPDAVLAGPWKCPYHNARVCYEMLARLGRSENKVP